MTTDPKPPAEEPSAAGAGSDPMKAARESSRDLSAGSDGESSDIASPEEFTPSALAEIEICLGLVVNQDFRSGRSSESPSGSAEEPSRRSSEFGRFRLKGLLGHGGFGVVYRAFDPNLNRDVALKIPRLEILASREHRARFTREGHTLATLDHPGIVPVHEAGEVDGIAYLATGYCAGPSLGAFLKERGAPLPARIAAQWLLALAEAVHHAHGRGILHRDLKPSNILLEPNAAGANAAFAFTPRVTDFGLAKSLVEDQGLTARDGLLGTPPYLAPEQALRRPKEITVQTDVYSLGAILYEMLTGRPPFEPKAGQDLLRMIVDEVPRPLEGRGGRVPRDLANICLKCLEKAPERRYASAAELGAELGRFLRGESVLARPIGRVHRVGRWCRRHPLVATLLLLTAGSLLIGSVGITWQWRRARLYAAAVEQSFIEAEDGLVNMVWVVNEMLQWSGSTDPFQAGNREQLLAHYERMIERPAPADPSPAYRASMATTRARIALLSHQPEEARRRFEEAIDLWLQLARARPEEIVYRQALVQNLFSLGALLGRMGQTDHPLSEPIAQAPLFEYLLALEPERGTVVGDYVDFLIERSKTLVRLDHARQAAEYFGIARGLAQRALIRFPSDVQVQRQYAKAIFHDACGQRRLGLKRPAIDGFTETNQWLDLVMKESPPTADDLLLRADSCRLQAACMRDTDRIEDAVTMFETARHFLMLLERDFGTSTRAWNLLASTEGNLAELYGKQNKPDHARLNRRRFCEHAKLALDGGDIAESIAADFAAALVDLAKEDSQQGRKVDAVRKLTDASGVFERVTPERSSNSARRLSWSECLRLLADLAIEANDPASAATHHRKAIAVLLPVAEDRPGRSRHRQRLADHRAALAKLEGGSGS